MSRPVHFEIAADDIARATTFFSDVFGWQFQSHGDGNYQMAQTGDDAMGINGGIFKRTSPTQPQVMNSIGVASVEDRPSSNHGRRRNHKPDRLHVANPFQMSKDVGINLGCH